MKPEQAISSPSLNVRLWSMPPVMKLTTDCAGLSVRKTHWKEPRQLIPSAEMVDARMERQTALRSMKERMMRLLEAIAQYEQIGVLINQVLRVEE
jgi:hypothetical protein